MRFACKSSPPLRVRDPRHERRLSTEAAVEALAPAVVKRTADQKPTTKGGRKHCDKRLRWGARLVEMSTNSVFRRRGRTEHAASVEAPGEREVSSDRRHSKKFDYDLDLDESSKGRVSRLDLVLAGVLLIFSACTRFYRLAIPSAVVFDEVHFYNFVSLYARRVHVFDIHPPLGKLILLLGGVVGNFRPDFKSESVSRGHAQHAVVFGRFEGHPPLGAHSQHLVRTLGFRLG